MSDFLLQGVLFHQDNAPAHSLTVAMATICDCGFEIVSHPPHSPDLTPSDFYLFPNTKKILADGQFANDSEVMGAVKEFLWTQEKEFVSNKIKVPQHRWIKFVSLNGDYVEKP